MILYNGFYTMILYCTMILIQWFFTMVLRQWFIYNGLYTLVLYNDSCTTILIQRFYTTILIQRFYTMICDSLPTICPRCMKIKSLAKTHQKSLAGPPLGKNRWQEGTSCQRFFIANNDFIVASNDFPRYDASKTRELNKNKPKLGRTKESISV